MRKLYWFILILVLIGVTYVVASKMSPAVDEWMIANVLTPIHGGAISVYTAIITSPTWTTYIAPWGWAICGVGGLIGGVLIMRWHVADKLRSVKVVAPSSLASKISLQREPAEPEPAPTVTTSKTVKPEQTPPVEEQEVVQ